MAISAGQRFGPYEILAVLASGGMGEVYRARDTRLDRTVAIKILPAPFADDPVRRERFEREARTIATFSHPHICALYDVGQQDGIDFLVFEHLEGETLEARLDRGPMPLDLVLRYGMELADALDQAHRRRIVHRDVKPANIAITPTGAKLLDFGLAQLRAREALSFAQGLPGETTSLTAEGAILGTVQYMAPEQVEGRETDHRADLFALGAVLYEMATGEKAFKGDSPASQMAAILTFEPPPASTVRPLAGVPRAFDHVVQRCLSKEPEKRWQSARDVMLELEWIGATATSSDIEPADGRRSRLHGPRVGSSPLVRCRQHWARCARCLQEWSRRRAVSDHPVLFTVAAPENGALSTGTYLMAVSPDGRHLAFVASTPGGPPFLWIRPLDSTTARALAGTEDASAPFWSPDGRSIAFVAAGKLKTVDIEGRRLVVLSSDAAAVPGAWSTDGTLLFFRGAHGTVGSIFKVSAQGGPVTPATTLDGAREEVAHFVPHFLPDGRHFLFVADGNSNVLCLASLDSPARIRTMTVESFDTRYVEPGYLLWHRGGTVLAQPFDVSAFRPRGSPVPIAERVRYSMGTDFSVFSTSSTGVLAYRPVGVTRLAWFDRRGTTVGSIEPSGSYLRSVAVPRWKAPDFPGAVFTNAVGINARGDIVGRWVDGAGNHAYLRTSEGVYYSLDLPAPCVATTLPALMTVAHGINDIGDIVGRCFDSNDPNAKELGWLWRHDGTFTILDDAAFRTTDAWTASARDLVAGDYSDSNEFVHGYLWTDASGFVTVDFPGNPTGLRGVNERGDVTGVYGSTVDSLHGFLLRDGVYTTVDFPGSIGSGGTLVINDAGLIVGGFIDAVGEEHGFIAARCPASGCN